MNYVCMMTWEENRGKKESENGREREETGETGNERTAVQAKNKLRIGTRLKAGLRQLSEMKGRGEGGTEREEAGK